MTIIQRSLGRLSATTLVALLLTALLAPGCTKERPSVEDPAESPRYTTDDWEGSTYMSLALRGSNPPASGQQTEDQTGGNYQVTWQGDDIIENFAVFIVSDKSDKVQCKAGSVTDTELVENWDSAKQELLLKPFRSTPVSKQIFAFFNIPKPYLSKLEATLSDKSAFLKEIAKPIPYMGEQGITYDGDAPMLEAFRPDSHIATKEIATGPSAGIPDLPSFTDSGRPGYDNKAPRRHLDYPTEFFDTRMSHTKPGSLPCVKRKDRIISSGVLYNYLPEDNITEEEVKDEGRNLVQVYTRRVLAQAVVTTEAALVNTPMPELGGMVIKGVSFQVLNFEPTFYPIARTEPEGAQPGNKNTRTPLYTQDTNQSLINFSTYKSSLSDEIFTADALVRDRFFRSSHFVYSEEPAELDPADKDYAQKLLRETRIELQAPDKKLYDGWENNDIITPEHNTTFWGSCYVTESTHKWATDASSGYTTSNTPFFAVVAFFDTESLPWSDATRAMAQAKIDGKQQDLENALKDLRKELADKEAELAEIPESSGGGMSEADADAVFKTYEQWLIDHHNPKLINNGKLAGQSARYFNQIVELRKLFKDDKDEAKYLKEIATKRNKLREQCPGIKDKSNSKRRTTEPDPKKQVGSPTEFDDDSALDAEQKAFKETLKADRKRNAGDPNAEKRQQLTNEIAALKKRIEDFKKDFNSSDEKYPKEENNPEKNLEFYTPFIYEQGINRIFYSQADNKFYLNYHEIPKANRNNAAHTLKTGDDWLKELENNLPNGKKFPTKANGAPSDAAVLEPTQELLNRLSQLLNGDIKEKDLSLAERRSMDFYLYGRVAPGLIQYFDSKKARTDRMDLQLGYVAWYSAKGSDRVVSYPCYIRYRKEQKASISKARLMMVYYAWLNPNTKDPSNSYASPVLRNNIYHMHITGFEHMGLSAIPFVPRVQEGAGYTFLHTPFDPDETVPGSGAPLIEASGSAGQASSQSMPRSASYSITF